MQNYTLKTNGQESNEAELEVVLDAFDIMQPARRWKYMYTHLMIPHRHIKTQVCTYMYLLVLEWIFARF